MVKILDRYLFRELVPPFLIGISLFTFLLVMNHLLELAKIAIKGEVRAMDVASILFWTLPHILALGIPIAVLLSANLGLGRMSADNEITVLHASGVGLLRIGRALLLFALLGTFVDAYVTMRLMPKSNQKVRSQTLELAKRQFHRGIQPGAFYESYAGYVIYPSYIDEVTNVWSDVMVADVKKRSEPTIIFAKRGRLRFNEAEKFVVLELEDGESFVTNRMEPELSTRSGFEKQTLVINLEDQLKETTLPLSDRELTVGELLQEIGRRKLSGAKWRGHAVELHKKFSIPIACLVFAVIGLALGARNKSRGKSSGFVLSVAIILVYWIFLSTGERMGDQGQVAPWLAMWGANLLIGGIGLTMLVLAAREIDLGLWDRFATGLTRVLAWLLRLTSGRARLESAAGRSLEDGAESRRGERRGRTIVIRIPRFSPDFPRILDRYVLAEWGRVFGVILIAITCLYVIIDFTRLVDDIAENNIPSSTVVTYYEYALPNIIFLMLGPTCLVTTLLVIGIMSRNNEIIAMKSSGISSYRIVLPLALVATLVSAVSMVLNDRVLPHTNREAQTRREEILKGPKRSHQMDVQGRWMWGKEGRTLYNYGTYLVQENQMQGVTVYELDPERFTVQRIVYADLATWQNPGWLLAEREDPDHPERIGAWARRFDEADAIPLTPFVGPTVLPYPEGPDYFVAEKKAADELTFRELREYIASLVRRGFSVQHLQVRLYQKLSLPFAALVMTIIGIPFALRVGKRGNLFGVGVAIALLMAFWGCTAAFGPLGETGVLPAYLAAFAPNVIFLVSSLYMLLNLDG